MSYYSCIASLTFRYGFKIAEQNGVAKRSLTYRRTTVMRRQQLQAPYDNLLVTCHQALPSAVLQVQTYLHLNQTSGWATSFQLDIQLNILGVRVGICVPPLQWWKELPTIIWHSYRMSCCNQQTLYPHCHHLLPMTILIIILQQTMCQIWHFPIIITLCELKRHIICYMNT